MVVNILIVSILIVYILSHTILIVNILIVYILSHWSHLIVTFYFFFVIKPSCINNLIVYSHWVTFCDS